MISAPFAWQVFEHYTHDINNASEKRFWILLKQTKYEAKNKQKIVQFDLHCWSTAHGHIQFAKAAQELVMWNVMWRLQLNRAKLCVEWMNSLWKVFPVARPNFIVVIGNTWFSFRVEAIFEFAKRQNAIATIQNGLKWWIVAWKCNFVCKLHERISCKCVALGQAVCH